MHHSVRTADPAPDERRRSGATRAVLVALGVFLVLGLGAFGLFRAFGPAAGGSPVASVTVPDLDGLPQARAEAALRALDWLDDAEWDAVIGSATVDIHGGGHPVGAVRPAKLTLSRPD